MQSPTEFVAANIRAEAARKRVSQAQFADALGISQQSVSARLSGRVPIDLNELAHIARVLDVTPLSLIEPRAEQASA